MATKSVYWYGLCGIRHCETCGKETLPTTATYPSFYGSSYCFCSFEPQVVSHLVQDSTGILFNPNQYGSFHHIVTNLCSNNKITTQEDVDESFSWYAKLVKKKYCK
jgi:hypothetical protein